MCVKCTTLACSRDAHDNVILISDAFAQFERKFTVPTVEVLGYHTSFEGTSVAPSEMVDLWDA